MRHEESFENVEVLRWFARGRCLARDTTSGVSFLVEDAIPGEMVSATLVTTEHRRVAYTTAVRRAAPTRVTPGCVHAKTCSGCGLLHVAPAEEDRYKALVCSEVLARFAGVHAPLESITTIGSSERGDHRIRARFAVSRRADGHVVLGLRDRDGAPNHIADCPAATPAVRQVMMRAPAVLAELHELAALGDDCAVEVVEGVGGVAVIVHGLPPLSAEVAELLRIRLGAAAIGQDTKRDGVVLRAGAWPRQIAVFGVELEAAVDAWLQPSPTRADSLYAWVEAHAQHEGRRILDATCGTGGISLLLARRAAFVQGVDANIEAVRSAEHSRATLGADNAAFRGGLFETVGPRMVRAGERYDVAVVNPMRRTLGSVAMSAIDELGVARVLYLGPAPRAAADDIAELVRRGFVVERVAAANLHPGTGQVMLCVVCVR